mmetsp:Transcript_10508/g.33277  ORF Transcript_10508/g.33277 Transcript_10508/m.33277 type:complete len:307 (+) Transcript_10508:141-1061(+)
MRKPARAVRLRCSLHHSEEARRLRRCRPAGLPFLRVRPVRNVPVPAAADAATPPTSGVATTAAAAASADIAARYWPVDRGASTALALAATAGSATTACMCSRQRLRREWYSLGVGWLLSHHLRHRCRRYVELQLRGRSMQCTLQRSQRKSTQPPPGHELGALCHRTPLLLLRRRRPIRWRPACKRWAGARARAPKPNAQLRPSHSDSARGRHRPHTAEPRAVLFQGERAHRRLLPPQRQPRRATALSRSRRWRRRVRAGGRRVRRVLAGRRRGLRRIGRVRCHDQPQPPAGAAARRGGGAWGGGRA